MKQLIPQIQRAVSWPSAADRWPVFGVWDTPIEFATARAPMPWAATIRNLYLTSGDTTRTTSIELALIKNSNPTALQVALALGSNGPSKDVLHNISVAQFDDIEWSFVTPSPGPFLGNTFGWCVEIESQGNVFGVAATSFGACPVGDGGIGGALGNGFWQHYDATVTGLCSSYSICSVAGDLTTLVLKTYATNPSGGASWVGYIRLLRFADIGFSDPVIQDGTGGTVDTKCEITSGDRAVRTFSLHLEPGDIVEVLYYRTGVDFPSENNGQIGVGIGFVPDHDGQFMLTGGSNNVLATPGYVWPLSAQAETNELLARAPVGRGGFVATGLYIQASAPGSDADDEVTRWLRRSGMSTSIAVVLRHLEQSGLITGKHVLFSEGDFVDIFQQATDGSSPTGASLYWGLAAEATDVAEAGVIGPLSWVHWPRRIPGSPSETITDSYSDMDMQCPAEWENGFKEGVITQWGVADRPASHLFTGDWAGSTFSFQIADKQGRFRAQAASLTDRYWVDALTVRMTTRANRALYGRPFTVFSGPIIEAQPTAPLLMDVTLGDVVSQGLLSDKAQIPWRIIRDSFLSKLSAVSGDLDRDRPEPSLYGLHTRATDEETSPATTEAFRVKPIYLGIWPNLDGHDRHVWMVCGHATQRLELYVDGLPFDEVFSFPLGFFGLWWIPHQSLHDTFWGAPYVDLESDTYEGQIRRYTLIFARTGHSFTDPLALGDRELTAAVWGIEDVGDGTGELISDRFQQYKHFLINYVANQGPASYMSGPWLDNPTWDLFDGPVPKVDEASYDAGTAIGQERMVDGYIGAAAIGISAGSRATAKKWIADWNRSCACRFDSNHFGQMFIFLLRPTDAIKALAPLYTDAYEILEDSFATEWKYDEQATAISFKADYEDASGEWKTSGVERDDEIGENYGGDIVSEPREYPFAPGDEQARHLAILEKRIRRHKPTYIRLRATIGPNPVTEESLGYLDAGDYLRYVTFDAVQETRQERLAQVINPIVDVAGRTVGVVAMDCEDLIDYDVDSSPSP